MRSGTASVLLDFFKESSKGAPTEKEKGFSSCPPPVDSAMTIEGGL